jgi:hypothetical protein
MQASEPRPTGALDRDELALLTRSLISATSNCAARGLLLSRERRSFWEIVRVEYAAGLGSGDHVRTAEELQAQWHTIRPRVAQFLVPFTLKWRMSRHSCRDATTCREMSFKLAEELHFQRSRRNFQYEIVAKLLVSHEKWWSVLRPVLLQAERRQTPREEDGVKAILVRQQDLETMSTSEWGLSTPSLAVLRLQRQLILEKWKTQFGQQPGQA